MTLEDFQFELQGYRFGLGLTIAVEADGFDPGSVTWRTQDTDDQTSDTVRMGRDLKTPQTWAFSGFVDERSATDALNNLELFMGIWNPEEERETPGAVLELRYKLPGRQERVVYGRPRRFASPMNNLLIQGRVPLDFDFKKVDPLHYSVYEIQKTITIPKGTALGFEVPFTTPWTSIGAPPPESSGIVNTGPAKTWPRIVFEGPNINPYMEIAGWKCETLGELAAGQFLEIDTRPWVRSAYLKEGIAAEGQPANHMLHPRTRLDRLSIPPGYHEMKVGGLGGATDSYGTVFFRPASRSL